MLRKQFARVRRFFLKYGHEVALAFNILVAALLVIWGVAAESYLAVGLLVIWSFVGRFLQHLIHRWVMDNIHEVVMLEMQSL